MTNIEKVHMNRIHRSTCEDNLTRRIPGLRWWIVTLIFLAALINFLNRLTIAVLGPIMTAQLGLSNMQFAGLTTSFLVAYTVSQGVSGAIYDRIGVKRGFIASVVLWSLASMAHAFSRGLLSLNCLRFLLGIGEGGTWPGAAKVITDWFPARNRAFAMGICNSGTAIGSIIAMPLIVWIELRFGWRMSFLALGGIGFVWLCLWLFIYAPSSDSPLITPEEYALIWKSRKPAIAGSKVTWKELLRHREVWGIVMARFFGDPVWWLYTTWLPLYLYRVRNFTLQEIGMSAWIPFVAADAGSLFGGWLSGHLIGRGWTVNWARKSVILSSMVLMCCGIPAALTHSAALSLLFISIVLFGFQSWISNVQTLPSDYFPEAVVGSVMGLSGVGAGVGAMVLTQTTGFIVEHHSYTPILITAGLLPILATTLLFTLGKSSRQIDVVGW
jgi:ACS family hexuronate transporter-like MFS transporter